MSIPTEEEIIASDRYKSYRTGWTHGASNKEISGKHLIHQTLGLDYAEGYGDARRARKMMLEQAADRVGYVATVTRDAAG